MGALARGQAQVHDLGFPPKEGGASISECTTDAPQPPTPILYRESPQWLTPVRACFGGVRSLVTRL